MLKKIRRVLAVVFFVCITLLFVGSTGILYKHLGWMAKIQFFPAVMACSFLIVGALFLVTLVFGRIYCSIICPLGVMQDLIGWVGRRVKKNRYTYSKELVWLRWAVFAVFVVCIIWGIAAIYTLLDPYSSYMTMVENFSAPLALSSFITAVVIFAVIAILSFRNGRTYCNSICPIGTILSVAARYSMFRPVIDKSKCVSCSLCSKNCKSSCIDIKGGLKIDYSRCVSCGNCISVCKKGALEYKFAWNRAKENKEAAPADEGRRKVLGGVAALCAASVLGGGVADKVLGIREKIKSAAALEGGNMIVPPGALSVENMSAHCTGCQLCMSVCPQKVLKPSGKFFTLNQPYSSYEDGYCLEGCTKCSEVCPAGAIEKISPEQKAQIQIGTAVWDAGLCIPLRDNEFCGACGYACPYGAIELTAVDPLDADSPQFPVVDPEKCRGCGACENVCPSRPQKAIYVEGLSEHRKINI